MKVAFLGDIAFLGQFDKSKNHNAKNNLIFLKKELEKYDYVIANLESPLTNTDFSLVCKSMHLKADTSNVELLKYLNVSAVSLANNHIADYGKKGLQETIEVLDQAGIEWFGVGGKTLDLVIKEEQVNISGFCCYSTNGTHYGGKNGLNLLTLENLEKQLQRNEKNHAFSLVALHWGMEHTNYPAYEHVKLARRVMDKYSAVLCGHHPHIVQGIEKKGQSLVAYSLGNAIFDTCISRNGKLKVELNEDNKKGFILGVVIEKGEISSYETTGFYIGDNGITAYDMTEHLNHISEPLRDIESNVEKYEAMRKEQFKNVIRSKFGKHDLQWLLSRMNYYAIGARIAGELRGKRYKKEVEKFING